MNAKPLSPSTLARPARRFAVTTVTFVLAAGALASTAPHEGHPAVPTRALTAGNTELTAGYARSAADRRMATVLTARATTRRMGSNFSGTVIDAGSNAVLWAKNPDSALLPASTAKLVTASNALTTLGPSRRITTTVYTVGALSRIALVGAGDPTLSSAQLDQLARTTAARLKANRVTSVRVYVDDTLFPTPTLAPGWKASYVPADITPVRALVRDQKDLADTSVDAAAYFRSRLRAHGVTSGYYGRVKLPAGAGLLAASAGARVDAMVARMLLNSDNEIAEALHMQVGIRLGYGPTWAGAAKAQRAQMTRNGLAMTALHDGSGLSRSDRLTSRQLARLVDFAFEPANSRNLAPLRSAAAMPTAGRTGTLRASWGRFTAPTSKCAAGKVWAKTGTLDDAMALAGWTRGRDGRIKVFAFVVNTRTTTAMQQNVDMLAASVNGCY